MNCMVLTGQCSNDLRHVDSIRYDTVAKKKTATQLVDQARGHFELQITICQYDFIYFIAASLHSL